MDINSRIRILRKELGLKQYEFADSIGLKNGAISWMEKSGNTVTEQNIEMICSKFNVNKTWLLTGEGAMFTKEKEKADLVAWAERMAAEGDTFAHRLAVVVSKLTPEQLSTLADIAEQLVHDVQAAQDAFYLRIAKNNRNLAEKVYITFHDPTLSDYEKLNVYKELGLKEVGYLKIDEYESMDDKDNFIILGYDRKRLFVGFRLDAREPEQLLAAGDGY